MKRNEGTHVLIAMEPDPAFEDLPRGLRVRFCGATTAEIDKALDPSVEILLCDELPQAQDKWAGLKWVQLLSAGTDQLRGHPLLRKPGLRLANASGVNAVAVAEFAVARLLYHTKHLQEYDRLQRQRRWPRERPEPRPTLRDLTVAIVGYGAIGRVAAHFLAGFGAKIIAVEESSRRQRFTGYLPEGAEGDPEAKLPRRIVLPRDLPKLLPEVDAVILAVPLNDATRGMIGSKQLAAMKPSAVLINVARGPVVDTAGLLKALDRGQLAHAYLDVFDEEPLPSKSPLWKHPKVSISPHAAAAMAGMERNVRALFLENLKRYRSRRPLINELDPAEYAAEESET